MRKAVLAALEIRDEADILRGLDSGELETRALHGQRAQAVAPPDVSRQLRVTAQAEADAHQQAADARSRHDHAAAASASALAAQLAAERQSLEASNARYEHWSADTHATRDAAGKATAELRRRGYVRPDREPQLRPQDEPVLVAGWWDPEPSQRVPDMNLPSIPAPEPRTSPENEPAQDDRATRLGKLLARADQAAQRIVAQQAERQASSHYAARMELEAQTQAEAGPQAEAQDEAELELLCRC